MTERILGIILPVFSVILLGWLIARRMRPDMAVLNRLNIDVFGPFLILSSLTSKHFDLLGSWPLIAGSVAIVLGSGLLAWPVARMLGESPRTFVPPMMFNNCGNMGIPLAVLAYGDEGLALMVALFVTSNLLHFTLGQYLVRHRVEWHEVLVSPMVLATALGALVGGARVALPEWLAQAIKLVGDACIPLMLFSLGARMLDISFAKWHLGVLGAVVCPLTGLLVAAALALLLPLTPAQQGVMLIFSVLPPAVLNFLVAERYHQEPDKVASIVLIGNLSAVLFVPAGLAIALAWR
jgi:predicted permease